MAYSIKIYPDCEDDCTERAVERVFSRYGSPIGCFCSQHAKKKVENLNELEADDLYRRGFVKNEQDRT